MVVGTLHRPAAADTLSGVDESDGPPAGELSGGYVNAVVRVGETVRRPAPERAEFVHALLLYLEDRGWSGAPRFLGVDENDRQMLSYLHGTWPGWLRVEWIRQVWSEQSLTRVTELVRELHDVPAGSALAGSSEVVCHNDLAPRNTVFRKSGDGGYRPVAFIDWDLAARGRASTMSRTCHGSSSSVNPIGLIPSPRAGCCG